MICLHQFETALQPVRESMGMRCKDQLQSIMGDHVGACAAWLDRLIPQHLVGHCFLRPDHMLCCK